MKKVFLFLLGFFICINVHASTPADTVIVDISGDNMIYVTQWIVRGDTIPYNPEKDCYEFVYDTEKLEFVSFESIYNFQYDKDSFCITDPTLHFQMPLMVDSIEKMRPLWTFTFRGLADLGINPYMIQNIDFRREDNIKLILADGTNANNEDYVDLEYDLSKEKKAEYQKEYFDYLEEETRKGHGTQQRVALNHEKLLNREGFKMNPIGYLLPIGLLLVIVAFRFLRKEMIKNDD